MSEKIFDYIIVGAGMTGLNLGKKISSLQPKSNTLVLEKSKSCGGRMATRRISENKFDHGVQYIEQADLSQPLISTWQQKGLLSDFVASAESALPINLKCAKSGITTLAKSLAEGLNIQYNLKAISFEKIQSSWCVHTDNSQTFFGQNIILTSPLPQSIEMLSASRISIDPRLKDIQYRKALVFLVEGRSASTAFESYQENYGGDFFSIAPQHKKMNSQCQTWTIVMSEEWSEKYFELSDDDIINLGQDSIGKNLSALKVDMIHLKKWRYANAKTKWHSLFYQPIAGVYLAGDSFGGPNILGALASSNAICDELLQINS